jgi:hypothetical protein
MTRQEQESIPATGVTLRLARHRAANRSREARMFIVLLLVALVGAAAAMLTALPWLEGRLIEDLSPGSAEAPTGNS